MEEKHYSCKQSLICSRCGDCCRFIGRDSSADEMDLRVRKAMYQKIGMIYLYPLSHYTISISHKEKEILERHAKEQGMKLNIQPKKIIIQNDQIAVLDWFVDHNVCPFLKDNNTCTIYEDRPLICKVFPRQNYTEEEMKTMEYVSGDRNISFETAINAVKSALQPKPFK